MRWSNNSDFPKLPKFFIAWFIFCAAMGIASFVFIAYIIVKICQHFGIL